MTTLAIEAMAGRHIDAVRAIDAVCYSAPWSAAAWRNELEADDRCHLVARDGDHVVGHAGSLRLLDELHVTTVAVDPAARRQGIATRLIHALLGLARSEGSVRAATLEVRATDHRTQRLYARFGFTPGGVRPAYYSAPVDDAVVMWLDDLASPDTSERLDRVAAALGSDSTEVM